MTTKNNFHREAIELGKRIKKLREANQLTHRQLAKDTGVSYGLISHVELGKTTLSFVTVGKLATALGCTTDYLIYGEQSPTQPQYVTLNVVKKLLEDIAKTTKKELEEKYIDQIKQLQKQLAKAKAKTTKTD